MITLLQNKATNFFERVYVENPFLYELLKISITYDSFIEYLRIFIEEQLSASAIAFAYAEKFDTVLFQQITWKEQGGVRLLSYIFNRKRTVNDFNYGGRLIEIDTLKFLWNDFNNIVTDTNEALANELIFTFRQFTGKLLPQKLTDEMLKELINKHKSGTDSEIVAIRKQNKDRIIRIFIEKIESGEIVRPNFSFPDGILFDEKYALMHEWWNDKSFHLQFAIRNVRLLKELSGEVISSETIELFIRAEKAGVPFFVNPYYLSLLTGKLLPSMPYADMPIRQYLFVSEELVDAFGTIVAWEKEDIVVPGKPNAAGWILPTEHNLHRRYPEVAIIIPDSMGRACGGLCVSCQRMFDFQRGNLNFELTKLKTRLKWSEKLSILMDYYEKDSQLRDVLITGGDALMSSDATLENILNAIVAMAIRKRAANVNRAEGRKYAEITRIRLGTRLPVYLPQRITPELITLLKNFRLKAMDAGITQFFIQTHFETSLEITPEAVNAIEMLLSAGWIVSNQQVFTSAASIKGHTAKLRQELNKIGVINYYTFSVKGFLENSNSFATNARLAQELVEEKEIGIRHSREFNNIDFYESTDKPKFIRDFLEKYNLPFIATDRNIMNLPGVGKSLTFRTIGLTSDGRRVLEFEYDTHRMHSPVVEMMNKVVIVESKSIHDYLKQIEQWGEDISVYESIYGYGNGVSEKVHKIWNYTKLPFEITGEFSNFEYPES